MDKLEAAMGRIGKKKQEVKDTQSAEAQAKETSSAESDADTDTPTGE